MIFESVCIFVSKKLQFSMGATVNKYQPCQEAFSEFLYQFTLPAVKIPQDVVNAE